MKRYQAILFDLDGTLLPMDTEGFTRLYFGALAAMLSDTGCTAEEIVAAVWAGTKAMVRNDGARPNADAFWDAFCALTRTRREEIEPRCNAFYTRDFHQARRATTTTPLAAQAVALARQKADRVILATNPLFPMVAQEARLKWAGLSASDFDLVTHYGNSRFCKPNPAYFGAICREQGLDPARCLMIGNDEREDMLAASALGMDAWLVTDCLIPCADHPWQGPAMTFEQLIPALAALAE